VPELQTLPSQRPSAQTVPQSAGKADVVLGGFEVQAPHLFTDTLQSVTII
jgi:hypothetical protein